MSLPTTNYLTPTGREEAWRFTPIDRMAGLLDPAVVLESRTTLQVGELPAGVSFSYQSASTLPVRRVSEDHISIRAIEAAHEVAHLDIAAEAELDIPVFLDRTTSSLTPVASRVLITAGRHSRATVVIENHGNAVLAEDLEVVVEDGAQLTLISLQEWESGSVHAARQHAVIAKDASFISRIVSVGGSLVRLLPTVEYTGPGASAELDGLYFATDGQHLEHRVHVEHGVPQAKSRVNYKGALAGNHARSVWIGDVFIRAGASGTDTYELNRNLLLTPGARADSVPNLEIETGEIVGAGHASTTGRFDDEQLFYLESRGIPAEQARRLVIRGFFAEIVSKLNIEEIEERIMARIDNELAQVRN
jgi:Fe-S cluster assembly protein SufD